MAFPPSRVCGKPRQGPASRAGGSGGIVAEERGNKYLRTAEVARLLHVSPKTVTRWAKDGKLPHSRTLGGHRRFPAEAIDKVARDMVESG